LSFVPESIVPNLLVDMVKGVQYMNEVKDSMVSAFQLSSRKGVLCNETMHGIRFNITDGQFHSDAAHRGGGQILNASQKLFSALEILGKPTLFEPIFLCAITAPAQAMGGVYQTLNARRCEIIEEIQITGTPLNEV
jgi:elongation factor 2